MFTGMILGFITALLPLFLGFLYDCEQWKESYKGMIIGIIIGLCIIVFSSLLGMNLDQIDYEKKVNTYITTKQTIENAMQSKELIGLEKIELVKQINEQNQKLEELKVDVKQWYNFYLDESKVNELQPIEIKVGE